MWFGLGDINRIVRSNEEIQSGGERMYSSNWVSFIEYKKVFSISHLFACNNILQNRGRYTDFVLSTKRDTMTYQWPRPLCDRLSRYCWRWKQLKNQNYWTANSRSPLRAAHVNQPTKFWYDWRGIFLAIWESVNDRKLAAWGDWTRTAINPFPSSCVCPFKLDSCIQRI